MRDIPAIDIVLLCGDLYDYPDCHKLGGTGDVTSVWNAFSKCAYQVIGVHGNHDTIDAAQLAANVTVLDGSTMKHGGLTIGGVSGIIGTKNRNQRNSHDKFEKALLGVLKKRCDIVLLDQGPDDPQRNQKGDPSVRLCLERDGSGMVFFGHDLSPGFSTMTRQRYPGYQSPSTFGRSPSPQYLHITTVYFWSFSPAQLLQTTVK